jgi:hypothetical protein
MKRHTRSLLVLLPLTVALCSLLVQQAPDALPSGPLQLLPLVPR